MSQYVGGFIQLINYSEVAGSLTPPTPPVTNKFLLMDGTDFLLMDGTNFLLMGS